MKLRELTRPIGIEFKLINVTKRVQQILELANLDQVLDTCTVEEMFYQSRVHRGKSLGRDRAA
jgi:anti-anti-sigma regulatory factor